jgi:hypothetical protein
LKRNIRGEGDRAAANLPGCIAPHTNAHLSIVISTAVIIIILMYMSMGKIFLVGWLILLFQPMSGSRGRPPTDRPLSPLMLHARTFSAVKITITDTLQKILVARIGHNP